MLSHPFQYYIAPPTQQPRPSGPQLCGTTVSPEEGGASALLHHTPQSAERPCGSEGGLHLFFYAFVIFCQSGVKEDECRNTRG